MQMIALFGELTDDQANTYGLVLTSYGLPYTVRRTRRGWEIWVSEDVHDEAMDLIDHYLRENPHLPILDAPREPQIQKTFSGVWVSLLLLAAFLGTYRNGLSTTVINDFGAIASRILDGEIYRAVTSLLLHADFLHLAGNIAGVAIFGTAVCNIMGSGVGWLMILLSGIIGNLLNAWAVETTHISIGASTAVFGAVGILAAHSFLNRWREQDRHKPAWLPIAGGLGLLALLGTGPHSDITAHLFGFLAGTVLCLAYHRYIDGTMAQTYQRTAWGVTMTVVCLSWLVAIR
ncbi:hypothetical protein D3OALGA1CA_4783 [Olavius algarvensis associated proteobacterium Delta 3]|nr:hypothetical protein D3OALGB2SA_2058 [Olavius algarvensis associated proteobacterium Delta 3]CAB5156811.1 hypothetical protein D3OALGA1CA_4783 [Olavius algarvensis associated proteobacterium Delta 3]